MSAAPAPRPPDDDPPDAIVFLRELMAAAVSSSRAVRSAKAKLEEAGYDIDAAIVLNWSAPKNPAAPRSRRKLTKRMTRAGHAVAAALGIDTGRTWKAKARR